MPSAWRLTQTPLQRGACYKSQSKSRVEFSAVMGAATGKACNSAAHAANSWKFLTAIRTAINEPCSVSPCLEREIVTALLAGDSQIAAGGLPLDAVQKNTAPAGAELRENMR